jgi:hypothetical protein
MKLFQLLQRGEVTIHGAGVGLAVDGWKIGSLVVGPGIGKLALRIRRAAGGRDIAKGVNQMRDVIRDTIGLKIGDVVIRGINAPLLEIAGKNFAVIASVITVMGGLIVASEAGRGGGEEQGKK